MSLWFLPAIFAAAAIVAANLTIWLDARVDAPIGVRPDLVSDPGTAATFAGAIAAATLAFVAVVFATTLVAIQLAASQYSPRTVRVFIRSRFTRVTLGLFLATFVFSVIVLVSNRASVTSAKQFAPVVSVTTLLALTVATVFGFVAYLHGVVRLMRVQYLLETIATETRRAKAAVRSLQAEDAADNDAVCSRGRNCRFATNGHATPLVDRRQGTNRPRWPVRRR